MIDPVVISSLWQTHADRLLLICRAVGEPAEDAVQEAFVALSQQAELPDDPLAWLVRTARNQILQWRRGAGRRVVRERIVSESRTWFVAECEALDTHLDGQQVTNWLTELPDEQREIIVMHIWGGMTFRQIAAVADISTATANRIYHQGLDELRLRATTSSDQGTL